jgi:hypothetical protein
MPEYTISKESNDTEANSECVCTVGGLQALGRLYGLEHRGSEEDMQAEDLGPVTGDASTTLQRVLSAAQLSEVGKAAKEAACCAGRSSGMASRPAGPCCWAGCADRGSAKCNVRRR